VAAGLATPITGSRGALSWRWLEYFPVADDFYRSIEQLTGASFWLPSPAWKIFGSLAEKSLYENRWIQSAPARPSSQAVEVVDQIVSSEMGIQAPFGACAMKPAARLLTCSYLDATHTFFAGRGQLLRTEVNVDASVQIRSDEQIVLVDQNVSSPRIVFCQGIAARENNFFRTLPLHPARGDILTVTSQKLMVTQVLHGDTWIAPLGDQSYLVGATYARTLEAGSRDHSDPLSTSFREELQRRFERIAQGSFDSGDHRVVDQASAVRPASYDRHPLLGRNSQHPNVYCLNGLGSKGVLMAPLLASQLIDSMLGGELPASINWTRKR
jgi:glycine/D-amino acid oxidase-like deaminating enzyme